MRACAWLEPAPFSIGWRRNDPAVAFTTESSPLDVRILTKERTDERIDSPLPGLPSLEVCRGASHCPFPQARPALPTYDRCESSAPPPAETGNRGPLSAGPGPREIVLSKVDTAGPQESYLGAYLHVFCLYCSTAQ